MAQAPSRSGLIVTGRKSPSNPLTLFPMGIPGLAGTRRTPAPTSRSGQFLTGPPSGGRKAVKPEFQETDGEALAPSASLY